MRKLHQPFSNGQATVAAGQSPSAPLGRLLITAGPTHEPIDAVRFIGNRSSGRLGIALADQAARSGWLVTLLLGPTALTPTDSRVNCLRFRTTADLEALLAEHVGSADVLVQAAAVADFRPRTGSNGLSGKINRTSQRLVLEFDPTPDLLAAVAAAKRPDQLMVGFALEPRERLMESARAKLARKGLDLIVANSLETIDSSEIDAVLLTPDGTERRTDGPIPKSQFAAILLQAISELLSAKAGRA